MPLRELPSGPVVRTPHFLQGTWVQSRMPHGKSALIFSLSLLSLDNQQKSESDLYAAFANFCSVNNIADKIKNGLSVGLRDMQLQCIILIQT